MAYFILVLVIASVGFLIYKAVQDARANADGTGTPARREPRPRAANPLREPPAAREPRQPRQRRPKKTPKPPIDQAALKAHVAKLREAVAGDLISRDEAVASIIRHTDGAVGEPDARKLLGKGS